MATLKQICQNALESIHGVEIPDAFFGSVNETARRALRACQNEGNFLEISYNWEELVAEHTFTTVADQQAYTRGDDATSGTPSDFRKFANMSQWDRSNNFPVEGPVSPQTWQFFKSSVTGESGTITRWFRMRGTQLLIHPTPTVAGGTIAYDYYSKNWINDQSTGNTARDWTNDNDTARLDEDLLRLGTAWRFKKSAGFPFEAEYKEWDALLQVLLASNGGAATLRMDEPTTLALTNIPDQGFGLS